MKSDLFRCQIEALNSKNGAKDKRGVKFRTEKNKRKKNSERLNK